MKKIAVARGACASLALALGAQVTGLPTVAAAASQVNVGGYHDEALRAAQLSLTRHAEEPLGGFSVGGIRISVDAGDGSTVTGFTPRFGGLGLGRSSAAPGEVGSLLKTQLDPREEAAAVRGEVRVGPATGAEFAGLEVNWAATAEVGGDQGGSVPGESRLLVGGELALSGVRVDASVGQEPDLLGLDGNRLNAGLGYDFGALDARVGYSLVEGEGESATETSLFTLGSRLNLRPGLIVQGDLAYARGEQGDPATAGVVSLRFSF